MSDNYGSDGFRLLRAVTNAVLAMYGEPEPLASERLDEVSKLLNRLAAARRDADRRAADCDTEYEEECDAREIVARLVDVLEPLIRANELERIADAWQTKDWPLITRSVKARSVIGTAQVVPDWLRGQITRGEAH